MKIYTEKIGNKERYLICEEIVVQGVKKYYALTGYFLTRKEAEKRLKEWK